MFNTLSEIIKKIEGNVLIIGLDDKLVRAFDKNNKVNLYSIYANDRTNIKIKLKSNKRKTNKGKTINIKKLRKYINKKSTDFVIINFNEINKYYKYIIKDTIYINKNTIYIYADNSIDKEFIIDKYKRYNANIEVNDYKNGYIIKIGAACSKNNWLKDKLYFLEDTLYNIAEAIGNILIS